MVSPLFVTIPVAWYYFFYFCQLNTRMHTDIVPIWQGASHLFTFYMLYVCSDPYVNTAHSSMGRPIDQWAAKDGPTINRANGRPIHQWAQPTHQSDGYNNILI